MRPSSGDTPDPIEHGDRGEGEYQADDGAGGILLSALLNLCQMPTHPLLFGKLLGLQVQIVLYHVSLQLTVGHILARLDNHMKNRTKRGTPPNVRTLAILREVLGPGREIPTLGMIAAGTNYTRSYICYLFLGRRHGTVDAIAAVAGYLGVSLERLYSALRKPRSEAPVSHSRTPPVKVQPGKKKVPPPPPLKAQASRRGRA